MLENTDFGRSMVLHKSSNDSYALRSDAFRSGPLIPGLGLSSSRTLRISNFGSSAFGKSDGLNTSRANQGQGFFSSGSLPSTVRSQGKVRLVSTIWGSVLPKAPD